MSDVVIRDAVLEDLPAIDAIYNHYVRHSTCTYQYEPTTPEERLDWFRSHDEKHPVTVATRGSDVVGWGSLSWFRTRIGYRFTVENAVYVRHDSHRRGIGSRLLADLIQRGSTLGHRTIIAGISAEQEGSLRLHRAAGFVDAGLLRQVATKFEAWLDLVFLQRLLP